jgi:hypothetical protein
VEGSSPNRTPSRITEPPGAVADGAVETGAFDPSDHPSRSHIVQPTRRIESVAAGVAAGLTGAVALAFAVPALAGGRDLIGIDPLDVPATAAGFGDRGCDRIPGGTADGLDGWVFTLPRPARDAGDFARLEGVFQDQDGNVLRYDTDEEGEAGDDEAYLATPAGLTLIDAEATIDLAHRERERAARDPHFDLARTCPAAGAGPAA